MKLEKQPPFILHTINVFTTNDHHLSSPTSNMRERKSKQRFNETQVQKEAQKTINNGEMRIK